MKKDFNSYLTEKGEVGFVEKVISGLCYAEGLPGAHPHEMVVFESGEIGQILWLEETHVEILSFSSAPIKVGTRVARTDQKLEIAAGEDLLGSIIDPLGAALTISRESSASERERRLLETAPLGIGERAKIVKPCETGVTVADILVPLGKGQRELVIGDQKSGKTSFLLQALLQQVSQGAVGVYAVIGKTRPAIRRIEDFLSKTKITDKVVFVASSAEDPAGVIFLTPYSAMSIAEYFRDRGRDVILILDDLTTHAKIYREISLLGRRFPGRNSYPGDIFYIHAKLLERAGNFKRESGESSITCLPVVETIRGDITGYIQTNIMSMTDGHLFFDNELFLTGQRPAINTFLSVTRVGRQTQSSIRRQINRELTSFLSAVQKIHAVATFGAELNERVKDMLAKEKRVLRFFAQRAYDVVPGNVQVFVFGLVWGDAWKDKTGEEIQDGVVRASFFYQTNPAVKKQIDGLVERVKTINELVEGAYALMPLLAPPEQGRQRMTREK